MPSDPPAAANVPLQYHRNAAVRRWVGWLLAMWVVALGAAFLVALAWDDAGRIAVVVGGTLGLAALVSVGVAMTIARIRPQRWLRWTGAPGDSGLEVIDARGRTRARAENLRATLLMRWTIQSQLGRSQGLVVRFPGSACSIGARVQDGGRPSGSEPIGEPCVWLVPKDMWAEIERAVRPHASPARNPAKRRGG